MRFNLEDYEPVEERIKRFYTDHEAGRITTELVSDPNSISTVVVKAFLWDGERLLSTGLAFEKAGDGMANKTSHLENCETSAIGRALANYNYSGNKRASREEMQKVARGESQEVNEEELIEKARKATLALLDQEGLDPEYVKEQTKAIKNFTSVDALREKYTDLKQDIETAKQLEAGVL